MKSCSPVLVTCNAAIELRDAGVQFGYRKAGMHVGLLVGCVFFALAQYVAMALPGDTTVFSATLMIVGVCVVGIAAWCGKTMAFPHTPRLTLEELDAMRHDMNLPAEVFRRTAESVLHGSSDDRRAMEQTDVLLDRLGRAAAGE